MAEGSIDLEKGRGGGLGGAIIFLAAFSMMFSWLGVYAIPNALAAANVIAPPDLLHDVRPVRLLYCFWGLFGGLLVIGLLFSFWSGRHVRRLDRIAEEEESLQ